MTFDIVLTTLVTITAYAPGCGATQATKSGAWPTAGHSVAVDPKVFPLGTLFKIPSMPQTAPFIAMDTGRKVKGHHIDVYMTSCREAIEWGRQRQMRIHVLKPRGRP